MKLSKHLLPYLLVTVFVPRVYLLDWTSTPSGYMELYLSQDCPKFEYDDGSAEESAVDFEVVYEVPGEDCACCDKEEN